MKQITSILRLLTLALVVFAIGPAWSLALGAVGIATAVARAAMPGGIAFASAFDLTELVADFGAYYKHDPARRQRLKDKLYNTEGKFDSYFTEVETESTREEWAYSEHTEVLQPYQTGWTTKGDHKITPNPAVTFWAKYDLGYIPDHLVNTWVKFLRGSKLSVDECPFVQYVIENHVIPRGHEDWKTKVSFLGEYVAPTPGTAGAAETTADGVRKLLRDYYADSKYTPFTIGAVPSDPVEFVEYMNEMTMDIPEQHRDKQMTWRMNDDLRVRYMEGFMEKYNKMYQRSANEVSNLFIHPKSNIKVEGFTEMGSSDMIFITENTNSLILNNGSVKRNIMKVETLKRELYLFTDFRKGYFFVNPTLVWGNDQDLS